jgi:hypothetical protein
MPELTPPQESSARSENSHSWRVLPRIDAVSPTSKPSSMRPMPASRTMAPTWFHDRALRHRPNFFWRNRVSSPRWATPFQAHLGHVERGTALAFLGPVALAVKLPHGQGFLKSK